MPPPQLAADTPVLDIFQPVLVRILISGRNVLIPQTAGEENFGARLYQSSCIAGMPADHGRPAAGKC